MCYQNSTAKLVCWSLNNESVDTVECRMFNAKK